jgi:predicted acylesterase/phospholipase RssA
MPTDYAGLRVGVALSGGGFRAAILHAGVLDELSEQGVPVTNLGTVSGGSIIGSFVAAGGSPRDFANAVRDGRFRLARDLLDLHNALRLPAPAELPFLRVKLWPLSDFSRRDVQANLIDRVLLGGLTARELPKLNGPSLMVCMTDLAYGLSVGAMTDGFLLAGPVTTRFFRQNEAIRLSGLESLAAQVAVSGGFPVAFPPLKIPATITVNPQPVSQSSRVEELALVLADGGIRDNLGLRLLEAADEHARNAPAESERSKWSGFSPGPEWRLDLILVSDGGKFLQADKNLGGLAAAMRAIDLTGIETGALRAISQTDALPKILLSTSSTLAPSPDGILMGYGLEAMRNNFYSFFRPAKFSDKLLRRFVALGPDQSRAEAAMQDYLKTRTGRDVNLNSVREHCLPRDGLRNASPECAWWSLVSAVGEDIWATVRAFMQKPTLEDTFTAEEVSSIYRFGQYLVLLHWNEIQERLDFAVQRKTRVMKKEN